MKDLGELLIEIAQTLDANDTTINNLSVQIDSLIKTVDILTEKIKRLEAQQSQKPWQDKIWPLPMIPTQVPQKDEIWMKYTYSDQSICACGQNQTCQCSK